jgi:hypothetical protein
MRKGLFWVVQTENEECELYTYSVSCNRNGIKETDQHAYNSRKGDSFSHEATWPLLVEKMPQKIRNKPWNYFPRGRVEIANGKATVYYNPVLTDRKEMKESIIREFKLIGLLVRFVPDYSKHYQSKGLCVVDSDIQSPARRGNE